MLPQKRIFIFKTFDYHYYTFSSSFKWKVKRNFLARWKTSVAAERQKYLLITYFKKVAKNSLVSNINSLVQPHHCNPHPEKCPIILKKLWLHDMTNKDTITTTKPPRKPLVVAFWACFLQKKSTTNLVSFLVAYFRISHISEQDALYIIWFDRWNWSDFKFMNVLFLLLEHQNSILAFWSTTFKSLKLIYVNWSIKSITVKPEGFLVPLCSINWSNSSLNVQETNLFMTNFSGI